MSVDSASGTGRSTDAPSRKMQERRITPKSSLAPGEAQLQETLPASDKPTGGTPSELTQWRRVIIIASLGLCRWSQSAAVSLMLPFIAIEAQAKSPDNTSVAHQTEIGLIFSVTKLVEVVAPLLVVKDLPNVGSRNVVILSEFCAAGAVLLFAFVKDINDWHTFLGFCYAIRIVHGLGTVASMISVFTFLMGLFPNSTGKANGFFSACSGFGYAAGPFIGGFLYDASGFRMPFLVAGSFMLALSVFLILALPHDVRVPKKTGDDSGLGTPSTSKVHLGQRHRGILRMLLIPRVWIQLGNLFLANFVAGAMDAALPPHFKRTFHTHAYVSGLALFLYGMVFGFASLVTGHFLDQRLSKVLVELLACALCGFAFLLIGPATFLHAKQSLAFRYVSAALLGIGTAVIHTTGAPHLFEILESRGYGQAADIRFSIAGLVRPALSLGYSIGPVAGSSLTAALGFPTAFSLISLLCFGQAALVATAAFILWSVTKDNGGYVCGCPDACIGSFEQRYDDDLLEVTELISLTRTEEMSE